MRARRRTIAEVDIVELLFLKRLRKVVIIVKPLFSPSSSIRSIYDRIERAPLSQPSTLSALMAV
jgi:hypothetical protein